jgi:hypothetical protein
LYIHDSVAVCGVRLQQDHSLTADQTKALVVADPEVLNSKIDNLINLNDLTEEAILHNLRIRFKVRAPPPLPFVFRVSFLLEQASKQGAGQPCTLGGDN